MDDSHRRGRRGLDWRDVLDAVLATLCLLALLRLMGWFPFNGVFARQQGKGQAAQPVQIAPPSNSNTPMPVRLAQPASFEEVAKACVVICSLTTKAPCGSGVFVGLKQGDDTLRVVLLTAAHVARGASPLGNTNVVSFIVHRPNEKTDLRKTVEADGLVLTPPEGMNDIAMVDVTGAFGRMVAEGLDVKFIRATKLPIEDVPPNAVKGAFVVRSESFGPFGIGLGTEIRTLGMATELWRSNLPKARVRQPLALRAGVIATRHDTPLVAGVSEGAFIIDARLTPGFSGGPVFAMVRDSHLEYPALVGVCLGVVRGLSFDDGKSRTVDESIQSAYGIVTPLDAIFSDTPTE